MANKKQIQKQKTGFLNVIAAIYAYIIFLIFPLFYTNYYFNILASKYYFYCVIVWLLIGTLLLYGIINYQQIIAAIQRKSFPEWLRSLRKPDLFLILLLITMLISTLQSDYILESLWGNTGRHTGLYLWLLYGASYFIVSRNLKFDKNLLNAFLISGVLVSLFGITDYFQMDLLYFKRQMQDAQKAIYTSTIGNINTYTAYIALVVSLAFLLFATEENTKKKIYYYIAVVIGFFAIIMGNSDNAYLSLLALFGFTPLYLFKNWTGVKRYLILVNTFLITAKMIHYINIIFEDKVIGVQSIFNYIANFKYLTLLIIGIFLIILLLHFYQKAFKDKIQDSIGIWLRGFWILVIVLSAAGICYCIYKVNTDPAWGTNPLLEYFRFSDSWGTNRGYIWRKLMELFNGFSIPRKIFGYGPDTFKILMENNFYPEMTSLYQVTFDSAHNEYLQFLITIGLSGLLFYLLFIGSSLVYMIKRSKGAPHVMAIVFAVIVYSFQAVVNINLPIITPVVMTLIMVGIAFSRDQENVIQ